MLENELEQRIKDEMELRHFLIGDREIDITDN